MKKLFAVAVACSVLAIGSVPAVAAPPEGNAYGYWAGALCDHEVAPGVTYWESRGYKNRGQCVKLEGQSLARGEWDPADWPI